LTEPLNEATSLPIAKAQPHIGHQGCALDIRLMGFIIATLGEKSQGRFTCLRSIVA
jgi:hypothetical protein